MSGGRQAAASRVSPEAGGIAIYLCRDPVDFRKGINGLSVLVEATLKYDPFSHNLFCFVNKRRSQIKVLYWQRTGFCLWLKRLEEERFKSYDLCQSPEHGRSSTESSIRCRHCYERDPQWSGRRDLSTVAQTLIRGLDTS